MGIAYKLGSGISAHKHPSCWIPLCEELNYPCDYDPDSTGGCIRLKQIVEGRQKEVNIYGRSRSNRA